MAKQIRDVVTAADLRTSLWKRALFAAAIVIRLTVAYVERRHARHRRTSHDQMPWHAFAAGSVNHEFREQLASRQALMQRLQQRQQEQDGPLDVPALAAAAAPPVPRQRRGQSALQIFRAEWLQTERACGRARNPITTRSWQLVHAAFAQLQPRERALYEARSEASMSQTKRDRDALRAARNGPPRPDAGAAGDGAGLPAAAANLAVEDLAGPARGDGEEVPADDDGYDGGHQIVPLRESSLNSIDNRNAALENVVDQSQHVASQSHPVNPGVLASFFEPEADVPHQLFGGVRHSAAEELRVWASQSQHICGGGGPGLPDPVQYPQSCGALCKAVSSRRALLFHASIKRGILALAKAHAPNNQLALGARADLVVAGEIFEDDVLHHVTFFCFATGQGRRGRFPENAMFGRLMRHDGDVASPYQGLHLRHRKRLFVPSSSAFVHVHPPLDGAADGPLQLVTEDAMAHELCFLDSDENLLADCVVLRLLDWKPEIGRGDGYKIQGLQGHGPVTIPADVEPKPPKPAAGGEDDDIDFLADLAADRRKAFRKAEAAARARAQERQQQQPGPALAGHEDVITEEAAMMREYIAAGGDAEVCFLDTLQKMDEELDAEREQEIEAAIHVDDDEQVDYLDYAADSVCQPAAASSSMGPAAASRDIDNIEEALAALAIVSDAPLKSGTQYVKKADRRVRIGVVHTIFTGVKATCNVHSNCTCYITIPVNTHHSRVMIDLLRWLDEATRPGCSEVDHFTSSVQLRRDKYHMKVKGLKGPKGG